MKLFEVLDRHVEWEWKRHNDNYTEAEFRIGRRDVRVMFVIHYNPNTDKMDMEDPPEYLREIIFGSKDKDEPESEYSPKITNTGNEFEVFATVTKIIQAFVNKHSPPALMFKALVSEPSRVKLYKRFAKVLEKHGYETKFTGQYRDAINWVVVKK